MRSSFSQPSVENGTIARVEPDVADLGDPRHSLTAALARDWHAVDPRPPQLLELLEALDGTLAQLFL